MSEAENQEMHQKFLAMREMLKKIPGVIDVGLGFKEINGEFTKEISYVVYVEEKINQDKLPPEHVIPKEINGFKTDVVKIITEVNHIRPIRGGVKMEGEDVNGYGTLGCIATHPVHGRVILTNHHVLYDQFYDNTPAPVKRDIKVGQPGISCSWCCQCGVFGHVKDSQRRNGGNVDCGIAKINDDISAINEIDGGVPVKGIAAVRPDPGGSGVNYHVFPGDIVKKVGARMDSLTLGIVQRISIPASISEDDKTTTTTLNDQIEISHKDGNNKRFSLPGDSGSIILDNNNLVVGLHMSGTKEHDASGNPVPPPYFSKCNNIHNVLTAMNITINITPATGGGSAESETYSRAVSAVKNLEEENTTYQVYLAKYRRMLEETEEGREVLKSIKDNAREVRELVYHNRQVIVAWQRNQGPAFVASIVKKLKNNDEELLKEVNGISIHTLLEAMTISLINNGSKQLVNDVKKYSEWLLAIIDHCKTNEDLILQTNKAPVQTTN